MLFTKGQTQRGNSNATERKSKAINVDGVTYDAKMDRGVMVLTSDVSLAKDDKNLCWVNKLQLGNGQNYERTAMLIMLAESARFNCVGITPRQVDRLFINIYLLIIHLEISIQNISLVLSCEPQLCVVNSKQRTIALTLYA